ncbi:MAG: hypothetical protein HKO95_07670 [Rhodobacteraceae bacterium]|nr:hypothetical protein [Alphaproteobacteria bacterium]NNF70600.1 hypothetical protein [Paracoccaceae bacterium]NNK66599.1 hypothetical protein [Paracoccaceae bacterium]
MSSHAAYQHILYEARKLIAARPELADFAGLPDADLPFAEPEARALSVAELLPGVADLVCRDTRDLTRAIINALPFLRFEQTYGVTQVGAEYLARYGWFNLISPDGPFLSDTMRISIGFWGQGLFYPEHWHTPEEIYCVLAGGCELHAEGCPPLLLSAGESAEIASAQPHSLDMAESPLLAMAIWRGEGLRVPATMSEDRAPNSSA